MTEEVSIQVKVAVTLVMIASFLSSVIFTLYNSNALLSSSQNQSTEVVEAVSVQNIVSLRNDFRRYVDLYKAYEYYEPYINSISGVELDGTLRIHYLLNTNSINDEAPLKAVHNIGGLTGTPKIDNMYSNFLNEYCDADHSQVWLRVNVTPNKLNKGYDIYYTVIDREGW